MKNLEVDTDLIEESVNKVYKLCELCAKYRYDALGKNPIRNVVKKIIKEARLLEIECIEEENVDYDFQFIINSHKLLLSD